MISELGRAESWLLKSGIYILDRNDPNYGAIYSYYDHKLKKYELVYAEATGYVISLLKYLYSINKDSKLIDFARASGDWLVRLAERYNGIIALGAASSSASTLFTISNSPFLAIHALARDLIYEFR